MHIRSPDTKSPDSAKLLWLRNWTAVLTAVAVGALVILLIIAAPLPLILVVVIGTLLGCEQVRSLTRRAKEIR